MAPLRSHLTPLALISTLLGATPAGAAGPTVPATFCAPAADIAENAVLCQNNALFAQTGTACLAKFTQLVKNSTGGLSNSGDSASATQAGHFSNTTQEYAAGIDRLDYLVGVNQLAMTEMDDYLAQMILPADPSLETSVPCWQLNQASVVEVINNFRLMHNQLVAARTAAAANATQATGSENNLNGTTTGGAAADAHGQGSGAGARRAAPGTSDITGTQEERAKELANPQ